MGVDGCWLQWWVSDGSGLEWRVLGRVSTSETGMNLILFYYDAYVTFEQLSMCGLTARSQPLCLVSLIVKQSRYHGRGYIWKAPPGLRHWNSTRGWRKHSNFSLEKCSRYFRMTLASKVVFIGSWSSMTATAIAIAWRPQSTEDHY